jgi:hypothetical protein
MRLNLRLAAVVFGILVIGLGGRGILWALSRGRIRTGRKGGGIVVVLGFVGLALFVIGYAGYFFGRLIQAGISRQREFLADASAVQFTRNPAGITGALKKIGGYALGSTMLHNESGTIGHFFFAQAFRSGVTGLWSTHPPLAERIRAIDPQFDGKFFDPPLVVDVAHESFVTAGLAPPPRTPRPFDPTTVVASIGRLTAADLGNAQHLLESVPAELSAAAHASDEAPALLYALLLDEDADVRTRQRDLIARGDSAALPIVTRLEPALRPLTAKYKLPLLQLALPALKTKPTSNLETFFGVLDDLVHCDERVSPFEFALQKLVLAAVGSTRETSDAVYSFQAVWAEISIVLSVLARATTGNEAAAADAFAEGAGQLKLISDRLALSDAEHSSLAALDAALDRLAGASGPIKQRTLVAAAHVVAADGQVLVAEAELLRAVAATLDCPMPPIELPG